MKKIFILLFSIVFTYSVFAQEDTFKKEDSIAKAKNPYLYLMRNLNGLAYHNYSTVFCGLDVNFSNTRLSLYLQDFMNLSSKSYSMKNNIISEKYTPKVSYGNEYLIVKYYTSKTNNIPYFNTEDGYCRTIKKCEITGTSDLIINLFLNYWSQKITLGGYKQGEIANFQLMGDRVALYGVAPPNKYKIVISEDNIHFDYYKTFHIN